MKSPERAERRAEILKNFNPDDNGFGASEIFGLPFPEEISEINLIPVPWHTTVSYYDGTDMGPTIILLESYQLDLYDPINLDGWKQGISMLKNTEDHWYKRGDELREKAIKYIQALTDGLDLEPFLGDLAEINRNSRLLENHVYQLSRKIIEENKIAGVVGGEHSSPLGLIKALAEKNDSFGILHLDAHSDLRFQYEGFEQSHASIFNNALKHPQISKLIQVGIRDVSTGEIEMIENSNGRIVLFHDYHLKNRQLSGESWKSICKDIVDALPEKVYISYDIDCLEQSLCPGTGTPVPGGFKLEETFFLIEECIKAGKKIIGFDLCEVSPGTNSAWNGNVGARVLYKLCMCALKSRD